MNKFITPGKYRTASSEIVAPENSGLRFILNPINTKADFTHEINLALGKKWRKIREEGKGWFANRSNFKTGELQMVAVQSDVWAINIICLDEIGTPIEASFDGALKKVAAQAKYEHASIHIVESMLDMPGFTTAATTHFIENGLNVYVYSK